MQLDYCEENTAMTGTLEVETQEATITFNDAELQGNVLTAAKAKHFPHGIAWGAAIWIAVVHLGALAAPWTFTWAGLGRDAAHVLDYRRHWSLFDVPPTAQSPELRDLRAGALVPGMDRWPRR